MMEINFQERLLNHNDWATVLFVLGFIIIAINRTIFNPRFVEFSKLAVSNKYNKIYKDSSNMLSGFTISMFVVQLISFSFFLLLILDHLNIAKKTNGIAFIQVFTFLGVFILSKYFIEKIIATAFKIEEFNEQFNLLKVSYRTYLGFILLPIDVVLYYNALDYSWIYILIIALLLIINGITYFITLKIHQNLVLGKIFYFILYLCTLEIAPYYFMYYWITKK